MPEKENSSNLSDNLALKGENLRKVKQRNFVPARNGFFSVIFMVLTTVVYDVIHMLPSSEYDAGKMITQKIHIEILTDSWTDLVLDKTDLLLVH